MNLQKIKLFEAQGELRNGSLNMIYASTLPTDTFPIINFLVFLGVDFFKTLVVLIQDNLVAYCLKTGRIY